MRQRKSLPISDLGDYEESPEEFSRNTSRNDRLAHVMRLIRKEFPTDDKCLAAVFEANYFNHTCPRCGRRGRYHKRRSRNSFICNCGKHEIHPKRGTVLHRSNTSLTKWFLAIALFECDASISAVEISGKCGLSLKMASRVVELLRKKRYRRLTNRIVEQIAIHIPLTHVEW